MTIEVGSVLYTGVFLAVFGWLYGWLIGVVWSPFLLSARLRALFTARESRDWRVNYVLWIPAPAAVWAFVFGAVISLSRDVRVPGKASPLYVAGVDGIVAATAVSVLLWPILLLYVLPRRGYDWNPTEYGLSTALLVVVGLLWYLVFLIGPAYVISIFAGFGDVIAQ